MSANAAEQSDALEKLGKLLDRQRVEVRETEKLMETLRASTVDAYKESSFERISNITLGADYGFKSRSEGSEGDLRGGGSWNGEGYVQSQAFTSYGPPTNVWNLAVKGFMRNLDAIRGTYKDEDEKKLTKKKKVLREKLRNLTLDSAAIWEREERYNDVEAPLILNIPYLAVCYLLDYAFEGRYVPARFYLLETVARMPYFSYISMLHLYETLGWWRRSVDVKRIHFAE